MTGRVICEGEGRTNLQGVGKFSEKKKSWEDFAEAGVYTVQTGMNEKENKYELSYKRLA